MVAASTVVQAIWQGRSARNCVQRVRAARSIQAAVRGHLQRRKLSTQRAAAVRIQARWRAAQQTRKFRAARHSIVTAQSVVRRHQAVKLLKRVPTCSQPANFIISPSYNKCIQ